MLITSIGEQVVLNALNAGFEYDETLRSYLYRHDQKVVAVSWKKWMRRYKIVDGQISAHSHGKNQHLKITLPDQAILEISQGRHNFSSKIIIEGETLFAQDIHFISKNISFPVEEKLAKKIGPQASRLLIQAFSTISDECLHFARNTVDTVVDYGTTKGELFVSEDMWQETLSKAHRLIYRMDIMEKRILDILEKMEKQKS